MEPPDTGLGRSRRGATSLRSINMVPGATAQMVRPQLGLFFSPYTAHARTVV
jgi:hypothetical protein